MNTTKPSGNGSSNAAERLEQFVVLHQKLRTTRHNINNSMAVIAAAAEWAQRHPEHSPKLVHACSEKSVEIVLSMRELSAMFDDYIKTIGESAAQGSSR